MRASLRKRQAYLQRPARKAPPIVHDVLGEHGVALDAASRASFEPRFGHDFSKVRVHVDGRAADSAEAVDALAYTVGTDIVFARGKYQPATASGKKTIAHELAHVVQQSANEARSKPAMGSLRIGSPHDAFELEAERHATGCAIGRPRTTASPSLQRQAKDHGSTGSDTASHATPAQQAVHAPQIEIGDLKIVDAGGGSKNVSIGGVPVVHVDSLGQADTLHVIVSTSSEHPDSILIRVQCSSNVRTTLNQAGIERLAALGYTKVLLWRNGSQLETLANPFREGTLPVPAPHNIQAAAMAAQGTTTPLPVPAAPQADTTQPGARTGGWIRGYEGRAWMFPSQAPALAPQRTGTPRAVPAPVTPHLQVTATPAPSSAPATPQADTTQPGAAQNGAATPTTLSPQGRLFLFNQEAQRGVSGHTHWPRGHSGVTIGPGYDMRGRTAHEIEADLVAVGVAQDVAHALSAGAGLHDAAAQRFAQAHRNDVTLTDDQQVALMNHVVVPYERAVHDAVRVPLNDNQYTALVSFAYNVGIRNFLHSTLLRRLNAGDFNGAGREFDNWIRSGGAVSPGLQNRRNRERRLFQTQVPQQAVTLPVAH